MIRAWIVAVVLVGIAAAEDGEWISLFDGKTMAGWTSPTGGEPGQGWEIEDGAIHRVGKGGDLVSEKKFTNFELEFEWKVAKGANSGVKYRVVKSPGGWVGPEYQVLDDTGHPNGKVADTTAASLYEVVPAAKNKRLNRVGEWNKSRIIANGTVLEHWLNGKRVVKIDIAGKQWPALKNDSKFAKVEGFAAPVAGHILLQDHGDEVWFRSIRVRED